jgi:hypothetical protein
VKVAVRRSSYRETLPVGGRTGMLVHVERDPFIVLRCESAEAAAQGAPLPEHSIVAGHFILQSDPADMYGNLERGTHRRPDEIVSWSKLLQSDEFRAQAADVAGTPARDARA